MGWQLVHGVAVGAEGGKLAAEAVWHAGVASLRGEGGSGDGEVDTCIIPDTLELLHHT